MKSRFFWRKFSEREIYLILQGLDHVQEEYEDEILVLINSIKLKDKDAEERSREPLREQIAAFKVIIDRLKIKVLNHTKLLQNGTKRSTNNFGRIISSAIARIW